MSPIPQNEEQIFAVFFVNKVSKTDRAKKLPPKSTKLRYPLEAAFPLAQFFA